MSTSTMEKKMDHGSESPSGASTNTGVSAGALKSVIERVERLEEEKTGIQSDIREILKEAQGHGFDTKVIRQVIRIRKMDQKDRAYQEEILDTYIKPAVETDGGMISFKDYTNGIVTVELKGSCSGCPSSTITLKKGIEGMLTKMIPQVKEVVAQAV